MTSRRHGCWMQQPGTSSKGGDAVAALDLYRRSVAARGEVLPDKRCYLHGALLKAGLHEEAHRLADEIRRSAPSDPDVYSFMGENRELAGDLRQAHRWLTMGARRLELSDEEHMPPGSELSELVLCGPAAECATSSDSLRTNVTSSCRRSNRRTTISRTSPRSGQAVPGGPP